MSGCGNGRALWGRRMKGGSAWEPPDNRKMGWQTVCAVSARLHYGPARGDLGEIAGPETSYRPPADPGPAGPEPLHPGARGPLSPAGSALPPPPPGAAHSLLLRHLLPHPASLPDYRVRCHGAIRARGYFRLPLRAGAGLGLPGRPSARSSRWLERRASLGDFLGAGLPEPRDGLVSG